MFIGLFDRKTGYAADGFFGESRSFGAGTAHHEDLRGEGEVDPAGGDRRGDDASGIDPPIGFFNSAVG